MTDTRIAAPIPKPLTALIGREQELALLEDILQGDARLVTLTGIGGIGKTRLAHQAALELEPHFAAGVVIVPLADVRDTQQIPQTIATRLGHTGGELSIGDIAEMVGSESCLMLLDNLEQIEDAASGITALLSHNPAITVLATSQKPLDIPGEVLVPLGPLEVAATAESPAVALFCRRARESNPYQRFDAEAIAIVAEICDLLDGIPLALELAAARTALFTVPELRERLAQLLDVLSGGSPHAPARQRTMRNAIAWTYDLLSPDEARVFRYLSPYAGLSPEAVRHTLSALEHTDSELDTISFLIGRNLIRRMPTAPVARYQMLQTLREYGQEMLLQEGEDFNARLAHAMYVVSLAEAAEPHLNGPDQGEWYLRLGSELANIREACTWAAKHRPELTVRVISAIWQALQFNSVAHEYIELAKLAIRQPLSTAMLAHGHSALALLEGWLRTDTDACEQNFEIGLEHARACQDLSMVGRCLSGLGYTAILKQDLDTAYERYIESHAFNAEQDNLAGIYVALLNLAVIHSYRDEAEDAEDLLHQAIAVAERMDHVSGLSRAYVNLGSLKVRSGEPKAARDYAERALVLARDPRNETDIFNALFILSSAEASLGELERAAEHVAEGLEIGTRAGRQADCEELRTVSIDILLRRNDVASANTEILQLLQNPAARSNAALVVSCAESLLQYAVRCASATEVAAISASVETWKESGLSLVEPLPESDTHTAPVADESPEITAARERGQGWTINELGDHVLRMAQSIQSRLPESVAPAHKKPEPEAATFPLSPREREVLALIAQGHTNAEIADSMFISLRTITTHVTNIFGKLGVSNRTAASALARKHGLVADAD